MKFIEFGIGNRWLVRTETELKDGTEFEQTRYCETTKASVVVHKSMDWKKSIYS